MALFGLSWVVLAVALGLVLAVAIHRADLDAADQVWSDFCRAHGLVDMHGLVESTDETTTIHG
jgi:cbb3-type cytochrome oxidase subunit 1